MVLVLPLATLAALLLQTPATHESNPPIRIRYIVPEGFHDWACTDFGVDGARPLSRGADGVYEITPTAGAIPSTSSLPHLTPPIAREVFRVANGERRPERVNETHERSEYDSNSPVSRYCLFFGSSEEANRAGRPPTLRETRDGVDPILREFEFVVGALCDLRVQSNVCVEVESPSRGRVQRVIGDALRDSSHSVTNNCGGGFAGIVVQCRADHAVYTHSRARGPLYGVGEVRREESGKGTPAVAVWHEDVSGTAEEIATRFVRDARALLQRAATSCAR
jgi:hypothetical protein